MIVNVEVTSSAEAGLIEQAQSRGISLEEYARQVLEERGAIGNAPLGFVQDRLRAFDKFVTECEFPAILPDEAFDRENWYPDR